MSDAASSGHDNRQVVVPDTPPTRAPTTYEKGTDLRFYRRSEIDPTRFRIRLPCVVAGAYGYHYI